MSRFALLLRVLLWRGLLSVRNFLDFRFSRDRPRAGSFTRRIRSNVGRSLGSFDLLFYIPHSYETTSNRRSGNEKPKRHPVLINFHGGGFTIGHAAEDARWATAVIEQTSAVVISVDYRLAPRYSFPVPIEDCVSAILWVWKHADEFNLDISRTALSGFSAGGNMTYTVPIRLQEELTRLKAIDKLGDVEVGTLVALVSFYPSTDWTKTREQRNASNPGHVGGVPKRLYEIFDESYLHPPSKMPQMSHPLLSPGLASDEVLRKALPEKMVMITCGGDSLLDEGEKFRSRLKRLGKRVDGYVVEGVPHAWDKLPSFKKETPKRDRAYRLAVESLSEFWNCEDE